MSAMPKFLITEGCERLMTGAGVTIAELMRIGHHVHCFSISHEHSRMMFASWAAALTNVLSGGLLRVPSRQTLNRGPTMYSGQDRRVERRFEVTAGVECTFASPVLEDFGKVRVTNISRSGIGLFVPQRVAPGMMLAVELVNRSNKFTKVLIVSVIQTTEQKGGSYLVGGVLDSPLKQEELLSLIS